MKKSAIAAMAATVGFSAWAGSLCPDGLANAMPLKDGKAPVIDGKLDDWDLSGEEPCWNAEQLADEQYAILAFMYDEANLYISARMGLYDHDYINNNRPGDRYWQGDLVQVRLCTDPSVPHPMPGKHGKAGEAFWKGRETLTAVNLWKNTLSGEDNLFITAGPNWNLVMQNKPEGSAVKIVTEGKTCVIESRVPWKALGVKDGKLPVKPGDAISAIVDVKWSPGSDGHYTTVMFEQDPGAFAFRNLNSWGRLRFSPKGNLPPKAKTLESVAKEARAAADAVKETSTKVTVKIPKAGKLSVNIVDEKGGVVKELMGGEWHEAGEVTAFWDGRDALGYPCETGKTYKWKAYLHDGLDWEYVGTVGTSGNPPYETPDQKGAWGGDHGPVVAAAADASGRYFAWHMSEAGRGIVKTDFNGDVVWRKSPFVAGGYCPFTCLAAEKGKVWVVLEQSVADRVCQFVRLDAATGDYELFPDGRGSIPFDAAKGELDLPIRDDFKFNCVGCAVKDGRLYVSDTLGNKLHVLDCETGATLGTLAVEAPRGVCLYEDGLLVAQTSGKVAKLGLDGKLETLIDHDLELPQGIAVDAEGDLFVSDLGASQQLKKFTKGLLWGWNLAKTIGAKGGRSPVGAFDKGSFLYPATIAADKAGMILVPEMAPPKIVNLIEAKTGGIVRKYYGYTSYAPTTFPDCDDPLTVFYSLAGPNCFARARLPKEGGTGLPDACWDFNAVGNPCDAVVSTMNTPYVMRAENGKKYMVADGGPGVGCSGYKDKNKCPYGTWARPLCRMDADGSITPVACVWRTGKNGSTLRFWCDRDGDGKVSESETVLLETVGTNVFKWAVQNGSLYVDRNGDAYLTAQNSKVVRIANRGWNAAGAPDWDASKPEIAIEDMLPDARVWSGWRMGFLGMRRDKEGNFYAAINCNVKYVTEAYSKYMHQGMGHTADMNAVFMTKYDRNGKLVWRTGRKAIGGAKPGEILHHWCYAGLVNDLYTVGASEWACFTFYTTDGFYVDRIFDTPGLPPADKKGPKGMGGEDFSGQVVYFPDRDEVWAYNEGHVFKVLGFEKGRVKGEWRTEGTVVLNAINPLDFTGKEKPIGDVKFELANGKAVFSAHVKDDSPLLNVADNLGAVFKGGDAVGFEIGPKDLAAKLERIPERKPTERYLGFARILAVRIKGKDKVIGFKPFTDGKKFPLTYSTPAGGDSAFEFVGEVPGAEVVFAVDSDKKGYTAKITVPAAFFESAYPNGYAFEAEALLSGQGQRGLGTIERGYLHSPDSSQTTMTDDVPTESRLYPKGWK